MGQHCYYTIFPVFAHPTPGLTTGLAGEIGLAAQWARVRRIGAQRM